MTAEPLPTAAQLRQVLASAIGHGGGADGGWRIDGPPIRARRSRIFLAHTPLAPWPVAVKAFAADVKLDAILQQADILTRYHKAMSSHPGLTVPALWRVLPEHRILIMEWIDEPRIDGQLRWRGRHPGRRAELLAAAGRWLGHFHQPSTMRSQPLQTSRLHKHIDDLLGGDTGAGDCVPDSVFRNAYALLCRQAAEFAGAPVIHGETHGDFLPHNLLHGPRRTVGLDFKPRRPAPIARDMFRFLVQAEAEKPLLMPQRALSRWGTEQADLDAFLAGYGPLHQPADDALMGFFHLSEVLRRWAMLIGRGRARFVHPIMASRLRRMASHALAPPTS